MFSLTTIPPRSQICTIAGWLFLFVYPNLKYYTHWPQAWLGVMVHQTIPAAWIACIHLYEPNTGNPWVHVYTVLKQDWQYILPLWIGGTCFTLTYDTAYGYQVSFPAPFLSGLCSFSTWQDMKDDARLGLRSTSLLFGYKYGKAILTAFFVAFLATLYASAYITQMSALLLTAFPALYIGPSLLNVKLADPKSCGKLVWKCIKAEMWMTVAFSADLVWRTALIRA